MSTINKKLCSDCFIWPVDFERSNFVWNCSMAWFWNIWDKTIYCVNTLQQWNFSNGNDYGNGNSWPDVNGNGNDGICRNGINIKTEMITFNTYKNGNVCKENEKMQMIRTCSVNESLMLNHARSISKSLFATHLYFSGRGTHGRCSSAWPLDLHGPPPRWTTFSALLEVQVLNRPSSSTRTSVQSALDLHLQQLHWTSGLSRSIIITS